MNSKQYYTEYYQSDIGIIEVTGTRDNIISINFVSQITSMNKGSVCVKECIKQIKEYFMGSLRMFDLPFELQGTDFQKKVWNCLLTIPYGETRSYADIAKEIGKQKAARAVGNANKKNKLAIVIPCHRVIKNSGDLGGYASGTEKKEWLLDFEISNYEKE